MGTPHHSVGPPYGFTGRRQLGRNTRAFPVPVVPADGRSVHQTAAVAPPASPSAPPVRPTYLARTLSLYPGRTILSAVASFIYLYPVPPRAARLGRLAARLPARTGARLGRRPPRRGHTQARRRAPKRASAGTQDPPPWPKALLHRADAGDVRRPTAGLADAGAASCL
jgi:hypothetical protein